MKATMQAYESGRNRRRRYTPSVVKYTNCTAQDLEAYIDAVLRPHMAIWDEAILSAAIWFLREIIGIRRIFYHTFEWGSQLKAITGNKPPRSLYTRLPEKFCFRKTSRTPCFLHKNNNRRKQKLLGSGSCRFHLLDL